MVVGKAWSCEPKKEVEACIAEEDFLHWGRVLCGVTTRKACRALGYCRKYGRSGTDKWHKCTAWRLKAWRKKKKKKGGQ
jgi:hypothetical protein